MSSLKSNPLLEDTSLFHLLVDSVQDYAIFALDTEGHIATWNLGAERIKGYAAEEVIGRHFSLFYTDEDREAGLPAELLGTAEREGRVAREGWRVRKDGSRIWASVVITALHGPDGSLVGFAKVTRDLTERRAADEMLRKRERQLADAQALAGMGSWEWDVAANRVAWSDELYRIYGLDANAFGATFEAYLERVHSNDRDRVREQIEEAYRRGGDFEFEERIVRPDGSVRVLHSHGRALRDERGATTHLLGACLDITELRLAEERALRLAREQSAREAVEAARREDGRIVETVQHIGRSLASGLRLDRIVQDVTDAGTTLTGAAFGAFFYNVVDEKGEAYRLYTISGVPREAFSKFPMPRNTEVFEPTFHGTGVVRSDDITTDPRYGRNPPHNGMPEGHLPVRSYLAVPVTTPAGEVIGGLFFGHPEPGRFEERDERLAVGIAGWAALAMENARLFEAEHRARAEAERANQAKSDFLATMSHELRTPLNAMIGYSDLLLAGIPEPIPASAEQKVRRIGLSARHLLQLIEEILTFSRLEAGEEKLEAATVDVRALVEEVHALVEPLALVKELRLGVESPADGIAMHTDARKVRQILLNLLGNAVKFTDQGSVALTVEESGDDVVFRVADTGPGIAPEHAEQVFEPFWQVVGGATRTKEGTGLGLSVTRRLARLLGGDVSLESEPGRGSTFTVRLPRRVA